MSAIPFDNSYARLPDGFFTRLDPTPVTTPGPIRVNSELARELGIDPDWLASDQGTAVIAGNEIPDGADPIATVYAGHQFGSYNPQLGDGRAILLGEVVTANGERYDLQLKGAGRTPYSRGGDGRSPLGPVLREYIVSEAMHALGVPTTRALAAVTTGEQVTREQFQPGAILARVASSHIRIGTMQYFSAKGDTEALNTLVAHTLQRHYPDQQNADNPALALLQGVIERQAALIARWQLLGFIHGVMNTDNMLLSGETIDYGPCAFMDSFHPDTVFSSIDHGGRYAYRNQPNIAHWNLAALAQALLPVLDPEQEQAVELAQTAVDRVPELFLQAYREGIAAKLGLANWQETDQPLVDELFELLLKEKADFTLAFRRLHDLAAGEEQGGVGDLFEFSDACIPWLGRWRQRLQADSLDQGARVARMQRANPAFIPRNHLVQAAIGAAEDEGDLQPFHDLVDLLAAPHHYRPDMARYATPPQPEQVVHQTFCGT